MPIKDSRIIIARILTFLLNGWVGVNELAEKTGFHYQTVSRYLNWLEDKGIVECEKRRRMVYPRVVFRACRVKAENRLFAESIIMSWSRLKVKKSIGIYNPSKLKELNIHVKCKVCGATILNGKFSVREWLRFTSRLYVNVQCLNCGRKLLNINEGEIEVLALRNEG